MPRPKSNQPSYRFHVSGQARVTLDGKTFYLGPHGSPESYAKYYDLLSQYTANGLTLPTETEPSAIESTSPDSDGHSVVHLADAEILVRHVTADYRNEVLPKYAHNNGRYNRLSNLLDLLEERYADLPAEQFGPRCLGDLRTIFVKRGNCRKFCNAKVRDLVTIFRHAVSRELIGPERLTALQSLEPLKVGEAQDNPARTAVPIESIERTLPELTDTLSAMVRIQVATGCRPSELFRLTPAMVDRSADVWMIKPTAHKTSYKGIVKSIPLVGDGRDALAPLLFGDADKLCFVNGRGNPWNKDSYRAAINRAVERVNKKADEAEEPQIAHWGPYSIRHATLQRVRDELGIEAAAALAGHATTDITETYAKQSTERAIAAANVAAVKTGRMNHITGLTVAQVSNRMQVSLR